MSVNHNVSVNLMSMHLSLITVTCQSATTYDVCVPCDYDLSMTYLKSPRLFLILWMMMLFYEVVLANFYFFSWMELVVGLVKQTL